MKVQNPKKREFVVDADWVSTAGMALLLLLAVLTAIADTGAILHGRISQVSYRTIILAIYTIYLAASVRAEKLFRVGAAALGIGAIIRVVAHYVGLSSNVQWLAGINGMVFAIFACVVIFVGAAHWFRQVVRLDSR